MLVEFLELIWVKINNEREAANYTTKRKVYTPKDIEENIGFSKDFNVFELRKGNRETKLKAYNNCR
jgi:DNA polymerase-3 subunit delta